MKIVNLNEKFKDFLLNQKFKELHNYGVGLYMFFNSAHIFIPMTNRKKEFSDKDNRFLIIGENGKYGTLLIGAYIYVNPQLFTKVVEDGRVQDELFYFKKNKKLLEKKLKFQINRSKNHHDKDKLGWLNEYTRNFIEVNRKKAVIFTKKAIQSMAIIEKINFTAQEIEDIIEFNPLGRTDIYDVKTIFNLKDTWEYMIKTLLEPISLNYIILLNEKIANHQALKVGELRDSLNSVSGEFEIDIPNNNKAEKIVEKLNFSEDLEKDVMEIFYRIILEQWFYDGNKRTAFVTANKFLISKGIGVLLITDETKDEFNRLLYNCYKKRDDLEKEKFLKFLVLECITR